VARGLDPGRVFLDVTPDAARPGDADRALHRALGDADPCTAFLCSDDLAALTLLSGLAREGVAVPGDVSVVGHDDLVFSALLTPALTTVRPPGYDLGRAAAALVLAEADRGHAHRQVTLAPMLVVRDSTAAPASRPGSDPA
jgi:LacI family transcriptional regulator